MFKTLCCGVVRYRMNNSRICLVGLCALVMLHVAANAALQFDSTGIWSSLQWSLALCEVGLLAWWVAFGCMNIMLALSGWIGGMTILFIFSIRPHLSSAFHPVPWSGIDWFTTLGSSYLIPVLSGPAVLLCFLAIAHLLPQSNTIVHAVDFDNFTRVKRDLATRRQFLVRDIVTFLIMLAGSLSVIAMLQPYQGWMSGGLKFLGHMVLCWRWSLLLGACVVESVLITIAVSWLLLGQASHWAKCGLLACSILLSSLVTWGVSVTAISTITPKIGLGAMSFLGEAVMTTLISAASFLLLRFSGYWAGSPGPDI